MKTGIAEAVLVTMSLALAGCAISKVDKTGTNLYTLTYQISLVDNRGWMIDRFYIEAGKLCPFGWELLRETELPLGDRGATYEWEIRCV